jgi:hypothetical protein
MKRIRTITFLLLALLPLLGTIATASAEPNIGLLRVSSFLCPREVFPSTAFRVSLDVEYAIQSLPNEATIRGAVYAGNGNSSSPLWQSDPTSVSNGGDQVWNFTLNAPAAEGFLNLTAYAYFLDNGTWTYFNNPVNGPGLSQRTVKVGKTANLDISIGAPAVPVTTDGITKQTSTDGDAAFQVAVGSNPTVNAPATVQLQNATRIIFIGWSDGVTTPERQVPIDGDIYLTAQYRIQYLLAVTNSSTAQEWYDRGANVTLTAPASAPAPWPLNILGVTETFQGWSGDIHSTSPQIKVTMNSPRSVTADMILDYRSLVIPVIFAAGIAAAISFVLVQARSRNKEDAIESPGEQSVPEQPAPDSNSKCPTCGQVTEEEWAHCIKCGTRLKSTS